MNCTLCQREIWADPKRLSDSCRQHLRNCTACQAVYAESLAMERQLGRLGQLGWERTPAGLRERLLAEGQSSARIQARTHRRGIGLVASLMVIGVLYLYLPKQAEPLASDILDHVYGELNHLREVQPNASARLAAILNSQGQPFQALGLPVSYAGRCSVRNKPGLHFVLSGQQGPITVLVMPGQYVEHPIDIDDRRFHGGIYATPHGSFAIVGEAGERLAPIARRLRQSAITRL